MRQLEREDRIDERNIISNHRESLKLKKRLDMKS
jgi:hypothetical protein